MYELNLRDSIAKEDKMFPDYSSKGGLGILDIDDGSND